MKHGTERFASQQRFMNLVADEQDRAEARDDLEWAHAIGRGASAFLDALYRPEHVQEQLIETVQPQGGVL